MRGTVAKRLKKAAAKIRHADADKRRQYDVFKRLWRDKRLKR